MQSRIVSLLPGATEIVAALGLSGSLVARSHECDFPPEIRRLPACTAREIEVTESTPGIQLRAAAPEYRALSHFEIDWDLLRGLRPTHILTQTSCGSHRVRTDALEEVLHKELFEAPALIHLESRTLPGVIEEIRGTGGLLGVPARGDALADSLTERLERIGELARRPAGSMPIVACLEWLQPFLIAGNWMPEMIRLAGGNPAVHGSDANSQWMDWGDLLAIDPDVIVSMPCGWHLSRAIAETQHTAQRSNWKHLRAVRQNQVYVVDSSGYFSRPGPRLVDSLEILAEILSPDRFIPRYQGRGWVRFAAGTHR